MFHMHEGRVNKTHGDRNPGGHPPPPSPTLFLFCWGTPKLHKERGVDGGSRCRTSQCRRRPVKFKKQPCHMSLRPKKGRVALSILGVHTPKEGGNIVYNMHVNLPWFSTYINSDSSSHPQNIRTHLSKHIWLLLSLSICLCLLLAVLVHHPAVKFTVTYTWHCLVSTTRTMWCPLAGKSNITRPLVFTERTIL